MEWITHSMTTRNARFWGFTNCGIPIPARADGSTNEWGRWPSVHMAQKGEKPSCTRCRELYAREDTS